jgi:hypothetical protein
VRSRDLRDGAIIVLSVALLLAILTGPILFEWPVGFGLYQQRAEAWAALAGWVTASIALIAAVVGLYQLIEVRRTRERQVQPYVVVYTELGTELGTEVWDHLYLVIENVGQTPAYRVRPDLPPLTITPLVNQEMGDEGTVLPMPDEIGVLAPGQKWLTFWDSAPARENDRRQHGDRLGSHFEGKVHFQDSTNRSYTLPVILDWNTFRNTRRAERRTETTTTRIF